MNFKHLSISLFVCALLILSPTIYIVNAQSETQPFFMFGPQQPYRYMIFQESSYCYAKNYYGLIEYSGINTSNVINTVINTMMTQMGSGDLFLTKGTYVLDKKIYVAPHATNNRRFSIKGEKGAILDNQDAGQPCISISGTDSNSQIASIEDIEIMSTGKVGNGIFLDEIRDFTIRGVHIRLVKDYCIKIGSEVTQTDEFRADSLLLDDVYYQDSDGDGIILNGVDASAFNDVYGGNVAGVGWRITDCRGCHFRGGCISTAFISVHITNPYNPSRGPSFLECHFEQVSGPYSILFDGTKGVHLFAVERCHFHDHPITSFIKINSTTNMQKPIINNNFFNLDNDYDVALIIDVGCWDAEVIGNCFTKIPTITDNTGLVAPTLYARNRNFVTQACGHVEASNEDYISYGVVMASAPWVLCSVQEVDARYTCQPYSVNQTHFRLYLYDETAGVLETTDKTINWYAEYRP